MAKTDTKYLHAAARVRSLENRLITQQDLQKVIETGSAEEAFRMLSSREMFSEIPVENYEKAFENELRKTYELLEDITDNSGITYIFRYQADGHNLKVYAKSTLTEGSFSDLYKITGTFDPEIMVPEIGAKRFEKIPEKLGKAVLEAIDRLAKTKDSQIVDIIIDKAVIEMMRDKAQAIGNPLVSGYVAAKIDIINIETAARLLRMKKDLYDVRSIFSEGGTVSIPYIEEQYAYGFEGLTRLIRKAHLEGRLEQSIPELREGKPVTVFEQNVDGCFKDLFDKAKVIPFGLEPITAFLYLKEREIRAIRLVLVSKLFELPKEQITERLRYIYAD